jgi:hypothetical protein
MAATIFTAREETVWVGRQPRSRPRGRGRYPQMSDWQLALRRAAVLARTGWLEVPLG